MMIRTITLTMLLLGGMVLAQPGKKEAPKTPPSKEKEAPKQPTKPAAGSLEETLEKALRNSADIKAAESKVRDAEAELNKVRQQVLTKATVLHSDLQVAKRLMTVAENSFAQIRDARASGQIPAAEYLTAQAGVEKARGEVEKLEAQLKALRGEFAVSAYSFLINEVNYDVGVNFTGKERYYLAEVLNVTRAGIESKVNSVPLQSSMADRVRSLCDKEVEVGASFPIAEALRFLVDESKLDVPVRENLGKVADKATVELRGKLPIGAWIQAIEDSESEICVLVRDYGLLLTTKDRWPKGALSVSEVWKSKESKPKSEEKK